MPTKTPAELRDRIASLSPERRALLERMLAARGAVDGGSESVAVDDEPAPAARDEDQPLRFDLGTSEGEHKAGYRKFYDGVNRQLNESAFGSFSYFLNYGYVPAGGQDHAVVTLPDHYINKNSVRLVLELIGRCDLAGRRVLDVGCGRGGTCFVLHEFFRASDLSGIDLSPEAIAFCRKQHPWANFYVGDAESIPFDAGSFGVVTNVESSHTYPNPVRFYSEIDRVLRARGRFLYTDLLPEAAWSQARAAFSNLGYMLELDRDITDNVLCSCDETARQRVAAFRGDNDASLMTEFLGAPGSSVYESMRTRVWQYRILHFVKGGSD